MTKDKFTIYSGVIKTPEMRIQDSDSTETKLLKNILDKTEKLEPEVVYVENSLLKEIFGENIKNKTDCRYVKIYCPDTKKTIYRIARGGNTLLDIKKDVIYIDYDGKTKLLQSSDANEGNLVIKKCCGTSFAIHNPNTFNRISFIWAFWASVAGVVSLVLSVVSLLK